MSGKAEQPVCHCIAHQLNKHFQHVAPPSQHVTKSVPIRAQWLLPGRKQHDHLSYSTRHDKRRWSQAYKSPNCFIPTLYKQTAAAINTIQPYCCSCAEAARLSAVRLSPATPSVALPTAAAAASAGGASCCAAPLLPLLPSVVACCCGDCACAALATAAMPALAAALAAAEPCDVEGCTLSEAPLPASVAVAA